MNLQGIEIEAVYYAVSGFIRERYISGRPIPAEVLSVRHRLDAHVRLSSTRHETGLETTNPEDSEVWIGATATAAKIGRGLRYVQRHATDIGGQLIGGRYLFRETDVIDYMERLDPHGRTAT